MSELSDYFRQFGVNIDSPDFNGSNGLDSSIALYNSYKKRVYAG